MEETIPKLKTAMAAAGAIGRFVPLFEKATSLINDIISIYETAEYNQNICETLVERVKLTDNAIDTLKRRKQKNEDKFCNNEYYKAFNRLIYVLTEIKEFAVEISNLRGFKKYTKVYFIKEKFQKITNDYDVAMKDLQFTMVIASEEQRKVEAEALEEDLAEMSRYLEKMHNDILENKDKVDIIHDTVIHLVKHLDDKPSYDKPPHDVNVLKIDSKNITPPARGKLGDQRGKGPNFVTRRIYKGQDVACKPILKSDEEIKTCSKTQMLLEILMKLSESKNILRFYGISKIDDHNITVFEWAERGTLKQLYEEKHILWPFKVRIALEICRGLIFLQCAEILHHDLKCENILITESLEPKIYNFDLARYTSGKTNSLNLLKLDPMKVVPWLAPEKLTSFKSRYTAQCEIFSFAMLLWELAFEKTPYQGLNAEEIKDHVIRGKREKMTFGNTNPEISRLQEEYKKIINDTWKQNPQERISFMKLFDMLEELYNSVRHMFENNSSAGMLSDDKPNLDFSNDADLELPDEEINLVRAISLEEGIQAYRNGEHQKAWECFDFHAKNNNVVAKYWKGRYLWEGYIDDIKDREKGKKLLKEAADEGISDAQLRYAFTLSNSLNTNEEDRKTFMEYLEKAAIEGNNSAAQFNLGDIYTKGKCKVSKDENEGIRWLRKAALQDNPKAIDLLKQLKKNVYDI